MLKVLHSAVANAKNNHSLEENNLQVADIVIDEGFSWERFQPVSRGTAHPIEKRTSHISVVLEEMRPSRAKKKPKPATEIQTFTSNEFMASQAQEDHHDHAESVHHDHDHAPRTAKDEVRSVDTLQEKADGEAFQKTKMMQQGGDPKKTHRRKSM